MDDCRPLNENDGNFAKRPKEEKKKMYGGEKLNN